MRFIRAHKIISENPLDILDAFFDDFFVVGAAILSEEELKEKDAELKKNAKTRAEDSLRRGYVLEKIIETEKITLSDDDYKNVLGYFMQMAPRDAKPEDVIKEKRENGEFMRALQEIINQKTYDKIIELAQVVDVPPAEA